MDYGDILKRAWNVIWRQKILWVLAIPAAFGSRSGSQQFNQRRFDFDPNRDFGQELQRLIEQATRETSPANNPILALGTALLGIVVWVLSIAAAPGLVHLVNESEEGRPVQFGEGWRAGFANWGKNFALTLLLKFPFIALGIIIGAAAVFVAILGAVNGSESDAAGAILGLCCFGGLLTVVLALGYIVFGVFVYGLALRYVVIDRMAVLDSVRAAWSTLRARFKDVAVLALLLLLIGIGYGIVAGIVSGILALPGAAMDDTGAWVVAGVVTLIMLLPGAIFISFVSTAWTLLFRRLTGRDMPAAATTGGYPAPVAPAPTGAEYLPPPPPADAPAPPAPPAPPSESPAPQAPPSEPPAPPVQPPEA